MYMTIRDAYIIEIVERCQDLENAVISLIIKLEMGYNVSPEYIDLYRPHNTMKDEHP